MKKKYEFLDEINFPSDLKKIPEIKLQKLADELREEMIDAVSVTGGHLGASLGVVELTVALHYIFNTLKINYMGRWSSMLSSQILRGRKDNKNFGKVMVFPVLLKDQKASMTLERT